MNIHIKQSTGEKQNHDTICSAIKFFSETLFTTEQRDRINNIHVSLISMKASGEMAVIFADNTQQSYEIKLDKTLPFVQVINTLAHEMVHLHQHLRGDIAWKGDQLQWKGENYSLAPYDTLDEHEIYELMAWEREAYDAQESLSIKFFTYYYTNTY